MNKYKNIIYSFNTGKKKHLFIFSFLFLLILVVLHAIDLISWPTQEFTDEQLTPFVYVVLLVTGILAYRSRKYFVGFLLLQDKFVYVMTNVSKLQLHLEHFVREYNYEDVAKVVIGNTVHHEQIVNFVTTKDTDTASLLADTQNLKARKMDPLSMYIHVNNGDIMALSLTTTSKKRIHEAVDVLEKQGINVENLVEGL